jgi:hypothetical protein
MVRSVGSPTRLSIRDGASILILFIERKTAVGVAGTVVGITGVGVGAGSVGAAAGAQELNRKTNRIDR